MRCWGCIPFPWHPHWVLAGKSRHTHISFDTHTVSHWYKVPSLRLNVPRWVCGMHTCVTCIHAASSHCVQIITNGAHAVDPQTSPTLPVTCLSQSRMFHSMGKKKKKMCRMPGQKKGPWMSLSFFMKFRVSEVFAESSGRWLSEGH